MVLIFDYDGTLHDSNALYAPAFRREYARLVKHALMPPAQFSDEEIGKWLGWTTEDMWSAFAPELSVEQRRRSARAIGADMERGIKAGQARLFDGIDKALDSLVSDGHRLVFLSNCGHRYMEMHRACFELDRWFCAYYCSGDFDGASKAEIFETIRDELGTPGIEAASEFIVIGDRFHDMEIAFVHGLAAIGCLYGYGSLEELAGADALAYSPYDIPTIVEKIMHC